MAESDVSNGLLGQKTMFFGGHKYRKDRPKAFGDRKLSWRCYVKKCPGRLITCSDSNESPLEKGKHNHNPDFEPTEESSELPTVTTIDNVESSHGSSMLEVNSDDNVTHDSEVTLLKSVRGANMLAYRGFMYRRDKVNVNGSATWRCSSKKCTGRLFSFGYNKLQIFERGNHSHASVQEKIDQRKRKLERSSIFQEITSQTIFSGTQLTDESSLSQDNLESSVLMNNNGLPSAIQHRRSNNKIPYRIASLKNVSQEDVLPRNKRICLNDNVGSKLNSDESTSCSSSSSHPVNTPSTCSADLLLQDQAQVRLKMEETERENEVPLNQIKRGLVLGTFDIENDATEPVLTPNAKVFNEKTDGRLLNYLKIAGPKIAKGKSRVFYGLEKEYSCVSVVGLGPSNAGYNELEELEEKRENIRAAIGIGARQLRECGANVINIDDCGDVEAATEGASLSLFIFDDLKQKSSQKPKVKLQLLNQKNGNNTFENGLIKAEGQNIARRLMETPSNLMTPTIFAKTATELLTPHGVTVTSRDRKWAEEQKMGAFLSVTNGSQEPPVFLEIKYNGREAGAKPLVMVGKGVTFDSGGISIKPSSGMEMMRGDMGGAACTVGTIYSLAALKAPINIIGLIPLCENMPSGTATKPGDVVTAMNGKTIQVDNTDAEGRLILADALCYAHQFDPKAIVDLATLTGAIDVALGSAATGAFTNSSKLWMLLQQAGMGTGDRVWRMPLFKHYSKQVTESHLADVNNVGKHARQGGSCTAAAFLREFVTCDNWMHLDIAGVMDVKDEVPYLCKGMSGRPTRTLIEFAQKLAQYGW